TLPPPPPSPLFPYTTLFRSPLAAGQSREPTTDPRRTAVPEQDPVESLPGQQLPVERCRCDDVVVSGLPDPLSARRDARVASGSRSEEHTSELQSRGHLVCRL